MCAPTVLRKWVNAQSGCAVCLRGVRQKYPSSDKPVQYIHKSSCVACRHLKMLCFFPWCLLLGRMIALAWRRRGNERRWPIGPISPLFTLILPISSHQAWKLTWLEVFLFLCNLALIQMFYLSSRKPKCKLKYSNIRNRCSIVTVTNPIVRMLLPACFSKSFAVIQFLLNHTQAICLLCSVVALHT